MRRKKLKLRRKKKLKKKKKKGTLSESPSREKASKKARNWRSRRSRSAASSAKRSVATAEAISRVWVQPTRLNQDFAVRPRDKYHELVSSIVLMLYTVDPSRGLLFDDHKDFPTRSRSPSPPLHGDPLDCDNLILNIDNFGEAQKLETEPRKILGGLSPDGTIVNMHPVRLSAVTTRVNVLEGHFVTAFIEFESRPDLSAVRDALASFEPQSVQGLPSVHGVSTIVVRSETQRPQPRMDRGHGRGMTTVVGQLRGDNVHHIQMAVVSNNTVRGAAGGAILNAELLVREGFVKGHGITRSQL